MTCHSSEANAGVGARATGTVSNARASKRFASTIIRALRCRKDAIGANSNHQNWMPKQFPDDVAGWKSGDTERLYARCCLHAAIRSSSCKKIDSLARVESTRWIGRSGAILILARRRIYLTSSKGLLDPPRADLGLFPNQRGPLMHFVDGEQLLSSSDGRKPWLGRVHCRETPKGDAH